ncbi:sensor domain-containing diguanylate cyclase [Erythrobacter sp. HL-111]|uniref:sensor domain-containing diguanylate cyclase n=1 Tax=Erythrobacter sp. HL-111 TaxID=1798193 RepID=UPI0006D97960|nr:sensor domain-containing diguanylate cyclase [Erythrobacter sp. HL-111]KPP94444.1 MAG: Response regulator containing a CheY-like receiver domain and a GGDEF domain [Erythrobacteraceae bacterium HL-111]SDS57306.1 diguanylate cyclase (GGDEF) domain-containing protein [Erythrobacter sp. HL-111]
MIEKWSDTEGRSLHGLLEEAAGDIVLKLDSKGFIVHASASAADLGFDPAELLLMPHICELAARDHVGAVDEFAARILAGRAVGSSLEFPATLCGDADACRSSGRCAQGDHQRWYRLTLRPLHGEQGSIRGAIGLMRSVQHLRTLESELHARATTDPLTGLANRHAFASRLELFLRRQAEHSRDKPASRGGQAMLAVFAIDRMRAIFMQYGQDTLDEFLWGFAKFLETMVRPGDVLGQLDAERFGVIMPGTDPREARHWAEDVLNTFGALALPSSARMPHVAASAGLAAVEHSVDRTLRQAELGLVIARAAGGMQVGRALDHRRATIRAREPVDLAMSGALGMAANGR